MSRLAVYLLAMPLVLISLLMLGGRVLRSVDDARAPGVAGGETSIAEDAVSRDGSTSSMTAQSGTNTANDALSRDRDEARSMPDAVDPPGPAFPALMGWPGLTEAELRFASEDKDPQWATPMETRLLSMISQLDDLALSRLEVDCRESMCRLLLIYPPGIEPIYTIRQIYDRTEDLGLGPVLAEAEAGELKTLSVFLRRRTSTSSPR